MTPEKEKEIRLEHKLEFHRLLVDRVGVGLLIVLAAFFSNMLIENIKSNAIKERFILEQKLDSVFDIQKAHSRITSFLYSGLGRECVSPVKMVMAEEMIEFQLLKSEFQGVANSRLFLLSTEYQQIAHRIHNLTVAIALLLEKENEPSCEIRIFLHRLTSSLELMTRKELGLSMEGYPKVFFPIEKTPIEMETLGLKEYYDQNFAAWLQEYSRHENR